MKVIIKSALLSMLLMSTTAFSNTSDNEDITANVDFQETCEIVSAPAQFDFTGILIGENLSYDFSVTVECGLVEDVGNGGAGNVGLNIWFDRAITSSATHTAQSDVVVISLGETASQANINDSSNPVVIDVTQGVNQYILDFTIHVVDDVATFSAPHFGSYGTTNVIANISLVKS